MSQSDEIDPLPSRTMEELAELLRQRFLSSLYLGSMQAGARLPSLRQLASEYGVDVRAVRRAYQLLEHEGLVELRTRSGVFFAPAVERARMPLSPRAQWMINLAVDALGRAVPIPDLARRIARYTSPDGLRIACIECNDDQTHALCTEITRAFGVASVPVEVDEILAAPNPASDLADIDLLVTTPFHAGEVEELATRVGKPWLCMSPRSDIFTEIARLLANGPVYYCVGDERFAAKLKKIFGNAAHGERLIPLVISEGGDCNAPSSATTYITQLARERCGDSLRAHVRPSVCVFAPAASRALVTFIVSRNIARDDAGG